MTGNRIGGMSAGGWRRAFGACLLCTLALLGSGCAGDHVAQASAGSPPRSNRAAAA
mgnify:CR=1 FL=1